MKEKSLILAITAIFAFTQIAYCAEKNQEEKNLLNIVYTIDVSNLEKVVSIVSDVSERWGMEKSKINNRKSNLRYQNTPSQERPDNLRFVEVSLHGKYLSVLVQDYMPGRMSGRSKWFDEFSLMLENEYKKGKIEYKDSRKENPTTGSTGQRLRLAS